MDRKRGRMLEMKGRKGGMKIWKTGRKLLEKGMGLGWGIKKGMGIEEREGGMTMLKREK